MSEHTPEPWQIKRIDGAVICAGDYKIAEMWLRERTMPDARRIVACVNACAGISTKDLEDGRVEYLLNYE